MLMKVVNKIVMKVVIKLVIKVVMNVATINFKLFEGFSLWTDKYTNEWTDIGDCRVAFATEKQ